MAGVHRAQPWLRARAVREVPPGPRVGRRGDARALRAMDAAGGARAERSGRSRPQTIVGAVNLAQSIRRYGHLAAQLDPLGLRMPVGDPSLLPETHGLTEDDLRRLPANLITSPLTADARRTCSSWSRPSARIYCSTTGYDYAHVFVPEERNWLRHAAEDGRFRAPSDPIDPGRAARAADAGRSVRALPAPHVSRQDALLDRRARHARADPRRGDRRGRARPASGSILIGMAHRGRLNVMAHVLNKPYAQILAEFKDPVSSRNFREDMAWTGDVKYHAGAHRAHQGRPRDGPRRLDAAEPEPPRSGRSDRRGHGARGRDDRSDMPGRADVRSDAQRADPDSRRRGVPGPGHRRRDAEPEPAARLRHRRHDPHHRQQPARVHDRSRGRVQHVVRERPRARIQDSDRPRQRRRSGSVRRGGAAGDRLSRARSSATS